MEAASTLVPAAMPQHMQALAHANEVRLARAALKRSVASGEVEAAEIVRDCPWQVESMTVGELLRSQRRWGRTRARKFLFSLALNENRELGRLTARQRLRARSGARGQDTVADFPLGPLRGGHQVDKGADAEWPSRPTADPAKQAASTGSAGLRLALRAPRSQRSLTERPPLRARNARTSRYPAIARRRRRRRRSPSCRGRRGRRRPASSPPRPPRRAGPCGSGSRRSARGSRARGPASEASTRPVPSRVGRASRRCRRRRRRSAWRCRSGRRSPPEGTSPTAPAALPSGSVGRDRGFGAGALGAGRAARGRRRRADGAFAASSSMRSSRSQSRGAASPAANGQPEETRTRHQPSSIPSRPQRGRECQWRQPCSPRSSLETIDPAVLLGRGDHRLEQPPVRLLDLGPSRQLHPRLAHADRERVANPLELARAEQPRTSGGAGAPLDPPARERRGEELAELGLEAADLAPQVGAGTALAPPRRSRAAADPPLGRAPGPGSARASRPSRCTYPLARGESTPA